jgi:hypothetical protein
MTYHKVVLTLSVAACIFKEPNFVPTIANCLKADCSGLLLLSISARIPDDLIKLLPAETDRQHAHLASGLVRARRRMEEHI